MILIARTRLIHGHQRVQYPRGQPSLHHQFLEPGLGGETRIEMQRIVVTGHLGVAFNVAIGQCIAVDGFLVDFQVHGVSLL